MCKLTIVGKMPSDRSRERLQLVSSSRRSWEVQAPERMRAKMSMKSLSACMALWHHSVYIPDALQESA